MTALAIADFPGLFREIHGASPFQWQMRLLRRVVEDGWPRVIAAPTGAGKTAVVDIALFHLALESAARRRSAPLRIVFAVDRRVIVDQAFQRAKKLACRLAAPAGGPLAAMAGALSRISGAEPLHVAELRGGLPRESDWARTPAQPTILCTTIDQLGSRLLFRGYGVSESLAPIHAGLLGEDALLILDEAHLSAAFEQTLSGIAGRRRTEAGVDLPWSVCSLTATPRQDEGVFRLTAEERAEEAIAQRLGARKLAQLTEVGSPAGSDEHLAEFVQRAEACVAADGTVVAIVVNRVGLARSIFERLLARKHEAILLTGRVRPLARDRLIQRHEHRLASGRDGAGERPLFVVATQCIEAGADFDFDAMVSQAAPLDALRQRFGRLDRLGRRGTSQAAIIAVREEVSPKADDAIYGERSARTWAWLKARGRTVDFGPDAMDRLMAENPEGVDECRSPVRRAPVLRRADVDLFATTNPRPHPDPHLPLFLHGDPRVETDISIVWRADLPEIAGNLETLKTILAHLPPRSGEALSVPLWAARAWLRGTPAQIRQAVQIGDSEGGRGAEPEPSFGSRAVFCWHGEESEATRIAAGGDVRPGEVIVVPSSYGGCDEFGWHPDSTAPVEDIADRAAAPYEGRAAALRLHPKLWPAGDGSPPWSRVAELLVEELAPRELVAAILALGIADAALRERLERFHAARRLASADPYGQGANDVPYGLLLVAPFGLPGASAGAAGEAATEDDDAGSLRKRAVPLTEHAAAVVAQVQAFAASAGLPPAIAKTLAFAALHHDGGKADPRFQAWLSGGAGGELLAKSAERYPRAISGLRPQWRHEVLSLRLAARRLAEDGAGLDPELALYLIGTHHGQGRPFFRHDDDWDAHPRRLLDLDLAPGPGPERLDFDWRGHDWPGLVDELRRRYGVWTLAYLEAILRLADHRASEAADEAAP